MRAEQALQPVAHSVEDTPDEIQLPDVLEELVPAGVVEPADAAGPRCCCRTTAANELPVAAATGAAPRVVGTPVDREAVTGPNAVVAISCRSRSRVDAPAILELGAPGEPLLQP